jgi:hypothetical protein
MVVREELAPIIKTIVEKNVSDTPQGAVGKPYRSYNLSTLAMTPRFDRESLRQNSDLGVGIELGIERGRSHMVCLHREKLSKGRLDDVLDELEKTISGNIAIGRSVGDLKEVIERMRSVAELLSRRIKDPHPLIETITQAGQTYFVIEYLAAKPTPSLEQHLFEPCNHRTRLSARSARSSAPGERGLGASLASGPISTAQARGKPPSPRPLPACAACGEREEGFYPRRFTSGLASRIGVPFSKATICSKASRK